MTFNSVLAALVLTLPELDKALLPRQFCSVVLVNEVCLAGLSAAPGGFPPRALGTSCTSGKPEPRAVYASQVLLCVQRLHIPRKQAAEHGTRGRWPEGGLCLASTGTWSSLSVQHLVGTSQEHLNRPLKVSVPAGSRMDRWRFFRLTALCSSLRATYRGTEQRGPALLSGSWQACRSLYAAARVSQVWHA